MEILKQILKKNPKQPPNGVLPIFKLLFPNGSYRNGVCRALWALSNSPSVVAVDVSHGNPANIEDLKCRIVLAYQMHSARLPFYEV